jgi:hypothetical protein
MAPTDHQICQISPRRSGAAVASRSHAPPPSGDRIMLPLCSPLLSSPLHPSGGIPVRFPTATATATATARCMDRLMHIHVQFPRIATQRAREEEKTFLPSPPRPHPKQPHPSKKCIDCPETIQFIRKRLRERPDDCRGTEAKGRVKQKPLPPCSNPSARFTAADTWPGRWCVVVRRPQYLTKGRDWVVPRLSCPAAAA